MTKTTFDFNCLSKHTGWLNLKHEVSDFKHTSHKPGKAIFS